jgi:recombination protein RecT
MGRPTKDASGQIVRAGNGGGDGSLASFLARDLAPQIRLALPKHLDGDRMARVALTALRTNRDLADCDKFSFAASILQAAQLGLEVNTPLGHAYLIPRKGQCTLQLGYQGMIELARRSGQVSSIFAYTVHAGDVFEYTLGLDPTLKHIPNLDVDQSEATMTFVYAVAALKGGENDRQFVVLSKRQVDARKARGGRGDGNFGPAWKSDYLAMARKTAVRALFTWLPKSPEMARATVVDDREVTGAPMSAVIDAEIVEKLSTMQLPPPRDASADYDLETGEVPESEEQRLARELAEENSRIAEQRKPG